MNNTHATKFSARHLFALFAGLLVSLVATAQTQLTDMQTTTDENGAIEIVFVFDGDVAPPKIFATEVPPRIAVDLFGVKNATGKRHINVASGSVKGVRLVSAGDRTRAVLDLTQNAEFDTQLEGNKLAIKVAASDKAVKQQRMGHHQTEIQNIDFRRGKKGQGKVILKFNSPDVVVNTLETANGVILEIHNAQLPPEIDRKLDVVDFATPVSYIDAHQKGDVARIKVETSQANEHYAYQTGDQYVLEVAPVNRKSQQKSALEEKKKYKGARVSFNFQDIPVRSLLQMVADVSGFNVVVADSVQGNVTLRLKDVPWDQALDIILESKQLDKRMNGDVIWVAPAEEIAAREQQKLESQKEKEDLEPVKTIFLQVNYAKAEELANLLQGGGSGDGENSGSGNSLLSERGSVAYDERTNTLLITDIPSRLKTVEELIKRLDRPVQQVQIESRIVIASDKFGEELGVRFGVTGAQEDSNGNILSMGGSLEGLDRLNNAALINRLSGSGGSGLPNFDPDYSDPGNHIQGAPLGERLNVNLPSSNNAAKWAWSILASDYLLDLELSALETEGKGEVISTPRVITTNQKEAVIQKGVEIPYEQSTSSGATSVQFKKAVLELRVTPLITPDDRIDLTLKVSKDSVGQLVPTSRGGTVPSIDTRSIETRLLIENGQTVVLGGVYEHERRSDRSKVPFLGDLPAIGTLFRNKKISNDKAELLIFVTPTIIKQNF